MLGPPHLTYMCNNQSLSTPPLEANTVACASRPPGLLGGDGVAEIREITQLFEEDGIECCIVGVRALMFYGAGRVQDVSCQSRSGFDMPFDSSS